MNPPDITFSPDLTRVTYDQALERAFRTRGYLTLSGAVSRTVLANLCVNLLDAYERAKSAGELFTRGGTLSGHLNCLGGEIAGAGLRHRTSFESRRASRALAVRSLSDSKPIHSRIHHGI